ncbi:MAG: DUF748 domain-containing protein [Halioglobus sp.]|nr:DUF748 domain-containing protein [Halioglobus sp.]
MRTILRTLAIIYLAYLAITVLVIIPALNFLPHWYVQKTLNRTLHSEIILFNPFNLSLEARDVALPEHDGQRFVSLQQATVNLSLESIWQPGWVFDKVGLQRLYVHVRQLGDGQFNFSDMIPPAPAGEPPAAPAAPVPGLTVHRLHFDAQRILFSDESRDKHFSSHVDDLNITVSDLSTVFEDGKPYIVDAIGEGGGQLHWEGHISIPAAHSSGRLQITDLQLYPAWAFAEPWINFELTDGSLSATAGYSLDWRDTFDYSISGAVIRLDDLAIQAQSPRALPDTGLALQTLAIEDIDVDGPSRHASVAGVTLEGVSISGWNDAARVSLAELFATHLPQTDTTANPSAGQDSDSAAPWTAELGVVEVLAGSVRWRSPFTDPPVLELNPIDIAVRDIKWPLAGDSPVELQLTVNEQARLAIDGLMNLATGAGELTYRLQGLPLAWANPNLPAALKAEITAGLLGVEGQVSLDAFVPLRIGMDGAVTGFAGRIEDTETALTSWDSVRWERLDVDLERRALSLAKLALNNYAGRIHIRKDGSINMQNVWEQELAEPSAQAAVPDASQSPSPQESSADAGGAAQQPWTISLPSIVVTDSEIDFMDESLPLHFRTVIGDLNGEILDLGTATGTEARVNIEGAVDGYAPVVLSGTAEPFKSPPDLDLELRFDGVDLALLSPYSSTYAGYAIDRGLLRLDLKYSLQDSRLEGNNKVLIDQLKLGEKIDSDKAVDIPLKLALALLTDMNGVIDMEVPVKGDVDDPSFGLGSVIFKAFMNLLTKAVTAPFSLLANLVGTDQDLQRVSFASGSGELGEAARAKLDDLSEALSQRPELVLVITGRLNLDADREQLQKTVFNAQLLAAGLPQQELDNKGPQWEQFIAQRYQEQAPASGQDVSVLEQHRQLVAAVVVPEADLLRLAEARSVAVKSYLVNERQLEADRAVIEQSSLDDRAHRFSGVELDVGA